MAKTLRESAEPVTIVATGPQTNVAALLLAHPELKPKIRRISLMMIIYIAGLQAVPEDMLEAAKIDGASSWKTLWHITIPNVMKVLEFAFDAREPGNYLPHNYTKNCICYTGTHDNETLYQWRANLPPENEAFAREYLKAKPEDDLAHAILCSGMMNAPYYFSFSKSAAPCLQMGHTMSGGSVSPS